MLLTLVGWLLLLLAIACLIAGVSGRTWSAASGFAARASSGARVNYILAALLLGIVGWWLIEPPEFVSRYLNATAAPGSIDARVAGASTSNSPDASSQPLAMNGDMSASARTMELETRSGVPAGGSYGPATGATPTGYGDGSGRASAATGATPLPAPAATPAGGLPASSSTNFVTSGESGTRWARGDSLLPAASNGDGTPKMGTGGTGGAFPSPPSYTARAVPPAPVSAARDDLGEASAGMSSPPTPGWSNAPAPVRARLEGFAPGTGASARTAYAGTGTTPSALALPAYPASTAPTLSDIGTATGPGARRGRYASAAALPAPTPAATPTYPPATRLGTRAARPAAMTMPARAPVAVATAAEPALPSTTPSAPTPAPRRAARHRGWGPRPSSVVSGPLDVMLADRLGGDQALEVLRLTVEGREVARWRIDAESPSLDMGLSLPAPGLLHYTLDGEFLRPDGRTERLHGKGCTAFTQGRRLIVHRTRAGLMSLRQG